MRIPKRLEPLIEEGLIDEVVRPITAGKEAEVFVVWASGHLRAAKVYKEANQRSFKNRADYLDGRKTRGSRDARALTRKGRFAKEQEEEGWQTTELSALGRLRAAGVRVPEPRGFMEGVLIMDLVLTLEGEPAPRLADCRFTADEARTLFGELVHEVQRMLCAGIVHGDLSEYNVLLAPYGPVIIDFPQMIDAAASHSARRMLLRDLGNLRTFAARFAPELHRTRYGEEMWALYERAALTPDTELSGKWHDPTRAANVEGVRSAIHDAEHEHARRAGRRPPGPGGGRGSGPQGHGAPRSPAPQAPGAPRAPAPHGRPPRDAQPHAAPRPPRDAQPHAAPRPPRDAQPHAAPRPPRDAHPPSPNARTPRRPRDAHPPSPNARAPRPPRRHGP